MWKTHDSDRTSERAREREPNTPEKIAEPPLVAVPANPVPTLSTCGMWYHHTEIIKIIKSNRKQGKLHYYNFAKSKFSFNADNNNNKKKNEEKKVAKMP